MPLVHLGDLKGLSQLQQGRKIFDDYNTYAGAVDFLGSKYPARSPQSHVFKTLGFIEGRRPSGMLKHIHFYEDVIDYSFLRAARDMNTDLLSCKGRIEKADKATIVSPTEPSIILGRAYGIYRIMEELAIRRIEERNPDYNTKAERIFIEGKSADENSLALEGVMLLEDAQNMRPTDRDLKALLKSAKLFPAYISEAYVVTV